MELTERVTKLEEEISALRAAVSGLERGAAVPPAVQEISLGDEEVPAPMREIGRIGQGMARDAGEPVVVAGRFGEQSCWLWTKSASELRSQVDLAAVIRHLSVMASEPRLRMVQTLLDGERSAADIGAAVGLDGGPLYHHLGELQQVGIVRQTGRGRYALSVPGEDLFYFLAAVQIHWQHDFSRVYELTDGKGRLAKPDSGQD